MYSRLSKFESVFERHHRFVGWLGLICTCTCIHFYVSCHTNNYYTGTFVILGDTYDPVTRSWNLNGVALVRHQDFWFTMGMTVLYVLYITNR